MKQKENQEIIQDEIYKLIIPIEILTYFEFCEVVQYIPLLCRHYMVYFKWDIIISTKIRSLTGL